MKIMNKKNKNTLTGQGKPYSLRVLSMAGENNDNDDNDQGTGILTKTNTKTKKPAMYKVLLLNDDYTPMDFVIYILQKFFRLTIEDATQIMLQVHTKGVGVCGVFTFEVAETKVAHVLDAAKKHEHPLQCTLEEA